MAPVCSRIWTNIGESDSQCKEYISALNIEKMKQVPKVLYADHIDGIALNIIVKFDMDINYNNLHSCNSVLKVETIQKLGNSKIFIDWYIMLYCLPFYLLNIYIFIVHLAFY